MPRIVPRGSGPERNGEGAAPASTPLSDEALLADRREFAAFLATQNRTLLAGLAALKQPGGRRFEHDIVRDKEGRIQRVVSKEILTND